jgi:hypothetical protein
MATYAGFIEHADEQLGRLVSIGKSNGLFHRLRTPTLAPTLYHRVPPSGTPALSGSAVVPAARRPPDGGGVALLLRAGA